MIFILSSLMFSNLSCRDESDPARQEPLTEAITASLAKVNIAQNGPLQMMDEVGANCRTFVVNNNLRRDWNKTKYVFDELDLHHIRMAGWFVYWETKNGNEDPFSINFEAFDEAGFIRRRDLALAQYLIAKRECKG